jgi:hypothetical protein
MDKVADHMARTKNRIVPIVGAGTAILVSAFTCPVGSPASALLNGRFGRKGHEKYP